MADDLFKAVSLADKKRITAAANIINFELDQWLRHKPEVTQIIKASVNAHRKR